MIDKAKSLFSRSSSPSRSDRYAADKKKGAGPKYTGNFSQVPETLAESDGDSEDDIGKPPTLKQRGKKDKKPTTGLSYGESDDEEKEGAQLISLDGTSTSTTPNGN